MIACLLCGVAVARRYLLAVAVSGRSMEPTYHDGDRVLVRRTRRLPQAGALVVCRMPGPSSANGERGSMVIKRLTAVPGDEIPTSVLATVGCQPGDRVPEGRVVLLGDNQASQDSRSYGFVPAGRIAGVVVANLRLAAAAGQRTPARS